MSQMVVARIITALSVIVAFVALSVVTIDPKPAGAHDGSYSPEFTSDKMLKIPEGKIWREWPYVGSLVTPNALNNGEAPFPEHHMIYIDPVSWAHYKKTGEFREGGQIRLGTNGGKRSR